MKKLFLTLALVLMLVVTFVACGDTSGNNTDDAVEGPSYDGYTSDQSAGSVGLAYVINADGATCTIAHIGTCTDNEIVVPSTVDGKKVVSIGFSAFYNCTGLTSITIPSSVVQVGNEAFSGCTGLKTVTFAEDSQLVAIGYAAFYNCTGLMSIVIPDNVTNIGPAAFLNATKLESITVPDSVKVGAAAFVGTKYYDDESNWENGVLYIGKHLIAAKQTISGAYTVKEGTLTIGAGAFGGCALLESITMPDSLINIGNGFDGVIVSLDTAQFSQTNVFSGCTGLVGVYISNLATWCEINFGCKEDNPLYHAKKLYLNDTLVTGELVIPDGVTSIEDYAFYGYEELTSVTIPDSVTSIGASAFSDCTGLTSIAIPDSVTSIGSYAFSGCTGLTSIIIPDSITSIGDDPFGGCTNLVFNRYDFALYLGNSANPHIYLYKAIDEWVPSCTIHPDTKYIDADAFYGCTDLMEVHISDLAAWCQIKFGGVDANPLSRAEKLYINGTLVTGALIIPDGVTSIEDYAFYNYEELTSITIPDSVTSIGDSAFADCTSLTSIIIPDSVTSIGYAAFRNCDGLTSITIPDSVTSIKSGAYSSCASLTTIFFDGTTQQWESMRKRANRADDGVIILDMEFIDNTITVYCTDGNVVIEQNLGVIYVN